MSAYNFDASSYIDPLEAWRKENYPRIVLEEDLEITYERIGKSAGDQKERLRNNYQDIRNRLDLLPPNSPYPPFPRGNSPGAEVGYQENRANWEATAASMGYEVPDAHRMGCTIYSDEMAFYLKTPIGELREALQQRASRNVGSFAEDLDNDDGSRNDQKKARKWHSAFIDATGGFLSGVKNIAVEEIDRFAENNHITASNREILKNFQSHSAIMICDTLKEIDENNERMNGHTTTFLGASAVIIGGCAIVGTIATGGGLGILAGTIAGVLLSERAVGHERDAAGTLNDKNQLLNDHLKTINQDMTEIKSNFSTRNVLLGHVKDLSEMVDADVLDTLGQAPQFAR